MTTFDHREQAFEKKYVMDEEKAFRVVARRNRLMGLWAANLMDRQGDAAEAYVKEVIAADFEEAGDGDVLRKVERDLKTAGIVVTEKELRIKLNELQEEARRFVEQQSKDQK